jgi:hypothetical protein
VIDGDVAWIVGMSKGKHDDIMPRYLRGILVPMNVHTGKLAGPVIVAPAANGWPQSAFFGAALHPEGVVVTGYAATRPARSTRSRPRATASTVCACGSSTRRRQRGLAYGSDVVLDGQGRALVAAAVTQNGKLRGYVFGRKVDVLGPVLFEHWYPGVGPSEALGIVRDAFDRIFPVGYITVNGETQARSRGSTGRHTRRARRDHCGMKLPHASLILSAASVEERRVARRAGVAEHRVGEPREQSSEN